MTLNDFFSNTYVQTVILYLISTVIAIVFATRPRVVWSKAHESAFRIKSNEGDQPFYVYTSEIWVKNLGRAQASNLEIILNYRPRHYEIWTPRTFKEETLPDDRLALTFEALGPQDEFQISMLDTVVKTPIVIEIRHQAGLAKQTEMQTNTKPATYLLVAFAVVALVGFGFILYQVAAFFGPLIF